MIKYQQLIVKKEITFQNFQSRDFPKDMLKIGVYTLKTCTKL